MPFIASQRKATILVWATYAYPTMMLPSAETALAGADQILNAIRYGAWERRQDSPVPSTLPDCGILVSLRIGRAADDGSSVARNVDISRHSFRADQFGSSRGRPAEVVDRRSVIIVANCHTSVSGNAVDEVPVQEFLEGYLGSCQRAR